MGSGPEKSLALQCWGPKRLNQDGDFEVELKDLGNPSLGGGGASMKVPRVLLCLRNSGEVMSKKQWHGSHSLGRRIGKGNRDGVEKGKQPL